MAFTWLFWFLTLFVILEKSKGLYYVRLTVLEDIQMKNLLKLEEIDIDTFRQSWISYLNNIFIAVNVSVQVVNIKPWQNSFIQNSAINPSLYLKALKDHAQSSKYFIRDSNVVLLITGQKFMKPYNGLAYLKTICTNSSVGLVRYTHSTEQLASIAAHEIGHILGLDHDTCSCVANYTDIITSYEPYLLNNWSECCFKFLYDNKYSCLRLPQNPKYVYTSICGNGIVEKEEECECGLKDIDCHSYCNFYTCQFISPQTCRHINKSNIYGRFKCDTWPDICKIESVSKCVQNIKQLNLVLKRNIGSLSMKPNTDRISLKINFYKNSIDKLIARKVEHVSNKLTIMSEKLSTEIQCWENQFENSLNIYDASASNQNISLVHYISRVRFNNTLEMNKRISMLHIWKCQNFDTLSSKFQKENSYIKETLTTHYFNHLFKRIFFNFKEEWETVKKDNLVILKSFSLLYKNLTDMWTNATI